jgi:hypothetical protein
MDAPGGNAFAPEMEPRPPIIDEPKPVRHWRWWVHLILVTSCLVGLTFIGLARHKPDKLL